MLLLFFRITINKIKKLHKKLVHNITNVSSLAELPADFPSLCCFVDYSSKTNKEKENRY